MGPSTSNWTASTLRICAAGLLLVCVACGQGNSRLNADLSPLPAVLLPGAQQTGLPGPAELSGGELPRRQTSAAAYELLLSPPGMLAANAQFVSGNLNFFPADGKEMSWAIYGVSGFSQSENRKLISVIPTFEGGQLWVGVADFLTDRWVWSGGASEASFKIPHDVDYTTQSGQCYIAVVSSGQNIALSSLRFAVDKPFYGLGQGFPLAASDGSFDDRITVSWSGPDWATGYQLYRDSVGTAPLATFGPEVSSYVDTGVYDRIAHRYWVHALPESGMGSYSTADSGYLSGEQQPTGWKQYRANARRNGRASNPGPQNPQLLWQKDYRQIFDTEPALSADKARVCVGCSNEQAVYCVDSTDLSTIWTFQALSAPSGGGAFDALGNYYFADTLGLVYCLSSSGQQVWVFDSGATISESLALAPDGAVCFVNAEPALYCLEGNGSLRYRYAEGLEPEKPLATLRFDTLGRTLFVSVGVWDDDQANSELICLDAAGVKQWSRSCIGEALAVYPDGSGYAIADHIFDEPDAIRKLATDGSELWYCHLVQDNVYELSRLHLSIDALGTTYALVSREGLLARIDPDGNYMYPIGWFINDLVAPLFSSNGNIYLVPGQGDGLTWDEGLFTVPPEGYPVAFDPVLPAASIGRMVEPEPGVLIIPCAPTLARYDTNSQTLSYIGYDDAEGRSPVFDDGGNVYIPVGNTVRSYSPSGFERWKFELPRTDEPPVCTACSEGHVYFACGRRLYCLDGESGAQLWDFYNAGHIVTGEFVVSPTGDIYLYQHGNLHGNLPKILCLDRDGSLNWASEMKSGSDDYTLRGTICLDAEDNLILPVNLGRLKLSPQGEVLGVSIATGLGQGAAAGSQGFVYGIGSYSLLRIDPDGRIGWLQSLPYVYISKRPPISISPLGLPVTVLPASETTAASLVSFGEDGTLVTLTSLDSGLASKVPILDSSGVSYLGLENGELLAINPDGSTKWSRSGLSFCNELPAISPQGRIVFKGEGAVIYCLGD